MSMSHFSSFLRAEMMIFFKQNHHSGPQTGINDSSSFLIVVLKKTRYVKSFVAVGSKLSFVEIPEHCNWLSTAIQAERVTFHTLP